VLFSGDLLDQVYFVYNPELMRFCCTLCNNDGKYGLAMSPLMVDPQFGNKDFFTSEVNITLSVKQKTPPHAHVVCLGMCACVCARVCVCVCVCVCV
jgi:hypothetical protein